MFLIKLIDKIFQYIEKVLLTVVSFVIGVAVILIMVQLFVITLPIGLILSIVGLIITPLKPYISGFFGDFFGIIARRFMELIGADGSDIEKKLDEWAV